MKDSSVIKSSVLAFGAVIAGLITGFVLELSRFEGMRIDSSIKTYALAVTSYLIPTLWFIWRKKSFDPPSLAWLTVPVLGTIILQISVVQIPRAMGAWNQSNGSSFWNIFLYDPRSQAYRFFIFFIFFSVISCVIIGSAQMIGLIVEWLRRKGHGIKM